MYPKSRNYKTAFLLPVILFLVIGLFNGCGSGGGGSSMGSSGTTSSLKVVSTAPSNGDIAVDLDAISYEKQLNPAYKVKVVSITVTLNKPTDLSNVKISVKDVLSGGLWETTNGFGSTFYREYPRDSFSNCGTYTATVSYGQSSYSWAFKTKGCDTSPPTTPRSLRITPDSKWATISWATSSDDVKVSGYNIFRDGSLVG